MKIVCENGCFKNGDKPGFDADATAKGSISIKVDENGKFITVNECGYDAIDFGSIDPSSLRCGCCSLPAMIEAGE